VVEIYIVYGLSFLLLGVAALLLPADTEGIPVSRHFWLLGLFGLLHGGKELFDTWVIGTGAEGPLIDWSGALLLLISYLPLFEFARRAAGEVDLEAFGFRLPVASAWVYAPTFAASLILVSLTPDPTAGISAAARYFVGFPAALAAGLMLGLAFPDRQVLSRCLGAAFVAYGFFGGLITEPVPGFPYWLPNHQAFLDITGIPVQLFRAGCALTAMLCLSLLVHSAAKAVVQQSRGRAAQIEELVHSLEQQVEDRTAALRESEDRLLQAAELANLGYYIWDAIADRCIYCSEGNARIHGVTPEGYVDRASALDGSFSFVHPEDRDEVRAHFRDLRQGQRFSIEYRIVRPDGDVRRVREIAMPVSDESGKVVREHGSILDITESWHTEEKLRQAQKMESVGQLTGGVAHDFNNLLAVIMGNVELLLAQLGADHRALNAILRAATRGADLTQRLLAFSRQQALRPQTVDLRALVSEMSTLLSRTLGEAIEIKVHTAADLWHGAADPSQVENALLNLGLNARDAMPNGGRLIITCENEYLDPDYAAQNPETLPGDYVSLAVTDSGTGMSEDVRANAFDPFFTTKEVGQGSGLGLSMIYGFAKQSGGHVTIYSEEGQGTTVKLYLPRARVAGDSEEQKPCEIKRGQGQKILVIEDNPDVRVLAVDLLSGLGYRTMDVADADEARRALSDEADFDLVLSDVVLPGGTSGFQFAEQVAAKFPDLKVVFMSGYPAEAAKSNELLGPDRILLNKPFRREALAKVIHEALA